MHILKPYTTQLSSFVQLVDRVQEYPVTLGVFLDLNGFWFAAYRLYQAGFSERAIEQLLHSLTRPWDLILNPSLLAQAHDILNQPFNDQYIDLGWGFPFLRYFNGRKDEKYFPFIAKVIARPVRHQEIEVRNALLTFVREQSFPAIVLTRPPANLALAPGDKCTGSGAPGTIGGFVRNANSSAAYAMTCAHVIGHNQSASVGGHVIGTCTHAIAPQLQPGGVCRARATTNNKVDVALISVGASAVTNTAKSVAPTIVPKQPVRMHGAMTGVQQYEVGGTGVTFPLSSCCFDGLFEVRPIVSGSLLAPRVAAAIATIPVGGDSGSWIETVANPAEWCGMLVGADYMMGYAIEADVIVSEMKHQSGVDLVVA